MALATASACGGPADTASDGGSTTETSPTSGTSEGSTGDVVGTGTSSAAPTEGETSGSSGSGSSGGAAVCGDGVVEGDEACDDGDADPSDECLPSCELARCGDLVLQIGVEECEDGNLNDQDNCTNMCKAAVCGDGIVKKPGELCDDGNDIDGDGCSNTCVTPECGDGEIQPGEDCDEGVETAACNYNCTESKCGDGIPNTKAGEACDAGGESPTCDDDCTPAECGDGEVNMTAGEVCDDGGESPMCDDDCSAVECGDGEANAAAGEDCDSAGESPTCNGDCSVAVCGDGKINAAADEVCDDGGESAACDEDCSSVQCGDGEPNAKAGEACDDGNGLFGDTCSPLCLATPIALAPGVGHVCATYADESVHCWGWGPHGQLGHGSTTNLGDQPGELPTPGVKVGGKAVAISGGGAHTCARFDDGDIRCWGYNDYGQLGQGHFSSLGDSPGEMPAPIVPVGAAVLQVDTGGNHTCALIAGGTVRCWGRHDYGQLGYADPNGKSKPDGKDVVGVTGAVQLALGNLHSCALMTGGTVRCWGHNGSGQLGVGNTTHVGGGQGVLPAPEAKVGDANDVVQQIAAGWMHNCALLTSGKVRCWGNNASGQAGANFGDTAIGDKPGEMPPPDVNLGGAAVQVIVGQDHSCALMKSRKVKCWGKATANGYPGLGNINSAQELPPPDVDLGGDVASISGHAGEFTCALLANGALRCWGLNGSGQLGLGNTNPIGDNEAPASVMPVPL